MNARAIAQALDKNFRQNSDGGYLCRCPSHKDNQPSLKVSEGKDGKLLVYCHAGCDSNSIIAELGARGLWPKPVRKEHPKWVANDNPKPTAKPRIVKAYDYFDPETGELLMQALRMEPKSFRQRRPDPNKPGGWMWSVGPDHRTLYNAVRVSQYDKVVFVVEGEKDVDNLAELGVVATCNPGGAGKWQDNYTELLRGKDVVLVPDNDEAGAKHAEVVGKALQGVAKRVRVLTLPDLPDKGDVSDWIEAGGDRKQIAELVNAAPNFVDWLTSLGLPKPQGTMDNVSAPILTIGSDVEIANQLLLYLRTQFGEVVHSEGRFWCYTGTRWEVIPANYLRLTCHIFDGAQYPTSRGTGTIRLNSANIGSILRELETLCTDPEFFAACAHGINCASGFIRFAPDGAPSLEPHSPDHRCRHTLPGCWTSEPFEGVPRDSLLRRLLNGSFDGDDRAKIDFLAEVCGSAALGYATRLTEPKAIILYGMSAENGKSQILDLMRGLLPASAICSIPAAKIGDERHIVGLAGKLLNATDELSSEAIASDKFKAIVTGEPVEGRDVYKSRLEFRSEALHVFATNILPPYKGGMDRGVQRRLALIVFNRTVPKEERVERIGQRITIEEPDLLLAWAVEGASRLVRNKRYSIPEESHVALRDWVYSADSVLGWIGECVESNPGSFIESRNAYHHFINWANAEGYGKERLPTNNAFVQRVLANVPGTRSARSSKARRIEGMRIRS